MRGKAQPDGHPAVELIGTPVLLITSCGPKYTCTAASWSWHWCHLNMSVAKHTDY